MKDLYVPSASLGKAQGQLEASRHVAPPELVQAVRIFQGDELWLDSNRPWRIMMKKGGFNAAIAEQYDEEKGVIGDGEWSDGKTICDIVNAAVTFVRVSDQSPQGQDAERLDPKDESAVGNAETPNSPSSHDNPPDLGELMTRTWAQADSLDRMLAREFSDIAALKVALKVEVKRADTAISALQSLQDKTESNSCNNCISSTPDLGELIETAKAQAGYYDNGGCADHGMTDVGGLLRTLSSALQSLQAERDEWTPIRGLINMARRDAIHCEHGYLRVSADGSVNLIDPAFVLNRDPAGVALRARAEAAEKERDEARTDLEKLKDPTLQHLRMENGQLDMALTGEVVQHMGLVTAEYFRESGAQNYIEMVFHAKTEPFESYAVTIQKTGAKTPHMLRAEAEATLLATQKELAEARATLNGAADAINEAANADGISPSLREWLRSRRDAARSTLRGGQQ